VRSLRDSLVKHSHILDLPPLAVPADEAGMIKLRKSNAPTITKGPYAGEIVTGDHIIPRSVCLELDNALYNLEMMPLTLNQKKSAKIGQRQIDLAKRWNQDGLLSDAGLKAVLEESND
tara:strand:- start:497 stop:850 length:354 start_codon:yes stop_codon:yes gene_type:complete